MCSIVYAERWQKHGTAHFVYASWTERISFMQHVLMQHVPTTLHASCYFGGKHHGWVGASQCEERGGALHTLFMFVVCKNTHTHIVVVL